MVSGRLPRHLPQQGPPPSRLMWTCHSLQPKPRLWGSPARVWISGAKRQYLHVQALVSEPAALDFEDPTAAEQAQASASSTGGEQGMHRRVLPLPGLAAADSPAREDAEASVAIGSSSARFCLFCQSSHL